MKKVLVYLVATVLIPILGMAWWFTAIGKNANIDQSLTQAPVPVRIILFLLVLMLSINVAFGPTIYAFWRNKIGRSPILALNVICLLFGFFPSLWLWIWAICGKRRPLREIY